MRCNIVAHFYVTKYNIRQKDKVTDKVNTKKLSTFQVHDGSVQNGFNETAPYQFHKEPKIVNKFFVLIYSVTQSFNHAISWPASP